MRPPYFRPYGAQAFTRAVSASARTSVPRFWRIYLALWLIRRWRLPATPCLILPVAVSLKRFLTPLLVLSLGIFVSLLRLQARRYPTATACLRPGHWFFQRSGKRGAIRAGGGEGKDESRWIRATRDLWAGSPPISPSRTARRARRSISTAAHSAPRKSAGTWPTTASASCTPI